MKKSTKLVKYIPIPGFCIIIISFLFPFVLLNCQNGKKTPLTGINFISGINLEAKVQKYIIETEENKESKEEVRNNLENSEKIIEIDSININKDISKDININPSINKPKKEVALKRNYWLLTAFIIPFIGIFVHFLRLKNKYLITLILCFIGLISLFRFAFILQDSNAISQLITGLYGDISQIKYFITPQLGNAFYFASIVYLLIFTIVGFSGNWRGR